MLNKWTGIGRISTEIELKYTNSGAPVCNFQVACSNGGGKNKTQFVPCVAWNKTAENIAKYMKKGKLVYIEAVFTLSKNKKGNMTYVNANMMVSRILFLEGFSPGDKDDEKIEKAKQEVRDRMNSKDKDEEDEDFDVPF